MSLPVPIPMPAGQVMVLPVPLPAPAGQVMVLPLPLPMPAGQAMALPTPLPVPGGQVMTLPVPLPEPPDVARERYRQYLLQMREQIRAYAEQVEEALTRIDHRDPDEDRAGEK